jgi:hypothetical protein
MASADFPFTIHLDRRVEAAGVYNPATNVTTWTIPAPAAGLNRIVLGVAFGSSSGTAIPVLSATDNTVTATGNYSAGLVMIGRAFSAAVELTRPYYRDQNGNADPYSPTSQIKAVATYERSGHFQLRCAQTGRPLRTKTFQSDVLSSRGSLIAHFGGNVDQLRQTINSVDHRPFIITRVEHEFTYSPRIG